MNFADRMKKITPSATLAINAKALEMKAKGIAVTSLAVGEPDAPTPRHICEAAKKAIDENFTKYTPVNGIMEVRNAVCHYFQRQYQVSAKPENVILTTGGKQSLANTLLVMLNDGDDVLLPCPYWTSYPDLIRLAGGNPVLVKADSSRGFRIDPSDLEKAVTPRTRMMILNSPSNPTGVAYTQEELDALVTWCFEHDIFVLADEMYEQLVYDGKPVSASRWWEKHPERIAILNGLSKAFSMPGWRVGYTLGHEDLIKQCSKLQGQMTSHMCSIAQKAAVAALDGPYDCVEEMRLSFLRRRDLAMAEISTWPGVVCHRPGGAFYLFPDVSALFTPEMPSGEAVCSYLLEKARVACVPGEAFGDPHCIRLSYAVSDDVLMDALRRIKEALYR
ncbi:pyridoxal phosphate-dependent aminotransferase [uncultured Mailhella sp.]|uniref:pyridoxal phosphate-dependent aminotransferase n=1 Tax=uncultured Mailhella sp. TaxID=1981031 RepID=UPI0025CEFA5C|nr:pyridoxal phosphate-dependent aminotransferase [uncultured Mailhella sp.]